MPEISPSPSWPYRDLPRSGRDVITHLTTPPPADTFRETDVRGMVDAPFDVDPGRLNPLSANVLGRAFGTALLARGVDACVVGHDSRAYAPLLAGGLVQGLLSTGVQVVAIGLATTPMVYFAQHHLGVAGGVSVTASHNPNGWGGFKLSYAPSVTLDPDDVAELHELARAGSFARGIGRYVERSVTDDYVTTLAARVPAVGAGLDVVVDGANSIAGPIAAMALERAGHTVRTINAPLDWSFPNHEPDPELTAARTQLAAAVLEGRHQLGIAVDGDGDRLGVQDEQGGIVLSDRALALLAQDVLTRSPGATIVYDVKCSRLVADVVEAAGGTPVMWRTGHSHIKKKLAELGGAFGGERSGHFFDAVDNHGYDDAVYAALRLAQVVERGGGSVAALVAGLPAYRSSPTMHVHCPDDRKYEVVEQVAAAGVALLPQARAITVNGIRLELESGWVLIRASSNVPALVVVCEGLTDADLRAMYDTARTLLDPVADVARVWENDPYADGAHAEA